MKNKFYKDKHFAAVIEELTQLEFFRVKDLLEYHYSKVFISDSMSKMNWLTAFRINLLKRFATPEKQKKYSGVLSKDVPIQISLAYKWLEDKAKQIVIETNARMNNRPGQKEALDLPPDDILNFSIYLNEKGKPILSKLRELYCDSKPVIICSMLIALSKLTCLTCRLETANKTALHQALQKSFGKIGTRQSLSDNLNKLKADFYKPNIDSCKKEIESILKKS